MRAFLLGTLPLLIILAWAAVTPAMAVGNADGFVQIGTTSAPASMLGVYGGATIGTSYFSTTAPTDGLLVQGIVGIGTSSPNTSVALDMGNTTSAIILPKGTTGEEPTGVAGMVRYNTTTASFEGYDGSNWYDFGGAAGTFGAGTVSAPGWAVESDTATGLYQATASTLSIAAGGKEAARFLQGSGTVVNYLTFTGAETDYSPTIAAAGTNTNINLLLAPKGPYGAVIIEHGSLNVTSDTLTAATFSSQGGGSGLYALSEGASGSAIYAQADGVGGTGGLFYAFDDTAPNIGVDAQAYGPGGTAVMAWASEDSFGIYSASGLNYFNGAVGIGTTSMASALSVQGGVGVGVTYASTITAPTSGLAVEGNVVIGTATAQAGNIVTARGGVYALNPANYGTAISGIATTGDSGGITTGIYGESDPANGIGVWGVANADSDFTTLSVGVEGDSSGASSIGVRGIATGASGYGVYAEADGVGGFGGYFVAPDSTAANTGVLGSAVGPGGTGVFGEADGVGGYSVFGEATGAGGFGIYGVAEDTSVANTGVWVMLAEVLLWKTPIRAP